MTCYKHVLNLYYRHLLRCSKFIGNEPQIQKEKTNFLCQINVRKCFGDNFNYKYENLAKNIECFVQMGAVEILA